MAKLRRFEIRDDETVPQTISIRGDIRRQLIDRATQNKRSLSNEIMLRLQQSLESEERAAV